MSVTTKKQNDETKNFQNDFNQDLFKLQQVDRKPVIASFTAEKISSGGREENKEG